MIETGDSVYLSWSGLKFADFGHPVQNYNFQKTYYMKVNWNLWLIIFKRLPLQLLDIKYQIKC